MENGKWKMEKKTKGARHLETHILKVGKKFWDENQENKRIIRFDQL